MKKLACLLLCLVLLTGCTPSGEVPPEAEQKQYTATFLSLFDTVTTVVGYAESEEAFQALVTPIRDELEHYHRLFDIYNTYDGITNLKAVNDSAAVSPVAVDDAILDLLEDCREYYHATDGIFNPAMGALLRLWHDAREDGINDPANAYLPSDEALSEAAEHMNADDILIDREASTVFFRDPDLKIDVGGIAKGWAVQRVCAHAPQGLLISVGGNVYATGPKRADGTPWAVGIRNPDNSGTNLHVLNITSGSVVTSGSYQRGYLVDGKNYHHIIDPATRYPGTLWTSVTILCEDSGLADVLSTTLFLLDREAGQALLDRYGAEAMWMDPTGNQFYSPGYRDLIRNASR